MEGPELDETRKHWKGSLCMTVLVLIFAFLFVLRKDIAFGMKPLEMLLPLVVLPTLLRQSIKVPPGVSLVFSFLAYVVVHSIAAASLSRDMESLGEMTRYVISIGTALLLLTYARVARVNAALIAKFILWTSVIATPLSILGFLFPEHPVFGSFVLAVAGHPNRITGFDANPNFFSVYLFLCGSVALAYLAVERSLIYGLLLGNIFVIILLTFSRGAIGVFIIQFLIWLLIAFRPNLQVIMTVTFFFALGAMAVTTFDYIPTILERFARAQSYSGQDIRFLIWGDIIGIIGENPMFGIGLLNLKDNLTSISRELTAHNEYLNMVGSLGILGAILFFGFNLDLLRRSWYHFKRWREPVPLAMTLFLFGMAAWFMVDTASTSRVYWLGITLFWIYELEKRSRIRTGSARRVVGHIKVLKENGK